MEDQAGESLPERPAKAVCRERNKQHGWQTPPGNLVQVYLEACERHRVPANSAVVAQLQRRVRVLQPVPWQRVADIGQQPLPQSPPASPTRHAAGISAAQTRQELRDLVKGHVYPLSLSSALRPGTAGGSAPTSELHAATVSAAAVALAVGEAQLYAARAVASVCRLLEPRRTWEEQLAAIGLAADVRVLSDEQFHQLVDAATQCTLGELRQAVLEVLSRPVGHGTLDVEGLIGALFDGCLDVMCSGSIPAAELRAAVAAFAPAAAADMYGLLEQYPPLARPAAEPVTRSEFVSILTALAPALVPSGSSPGLVRDKVEVVVNRMLDNRLRPQQVYDFSRCYLGPRGLLPVLDVIGRDAAFVGLSLANCGLGCSSIDRLADWLQGHPNLTALDLSGNLIADRGGMALVRLLRSNRNIVDLGLGSTLLVPPRASRTHHDALGPSVCEDAAPVLEALASNRQARQSSPAEIVRALQVHGPELRALCYSLLAQEEGHRGEGGGAGHHDGRVPLAALQAALQEVTAEWGFTADALDTVLQHERLLGTATAGRTADDSGRLSVTYEELMQFLRACDQVLRVAQAFRNHLAEAKRLFFALAPEHSVGAAAPTGVSGPRTALSTVRQALIELAAQPGSGWDIAEADLEAVLSPDFLRAQIGSASTGSALPLGTGPPLVDAKTGLLTPVWAPAAVSATSIPSDLLVSWPELANTLLHLFNT